jgi:hypothetical protein
VRIEITPGFIRYEQGGKGKHIEPATTETVWDLPAIMRLIESRLPSLTMAGSVTTEAVKPLRDAVMEQPPEEPQPATRRRKRLRRSILNAPDEPAD